MITFLAHPALLCAKRCPRCGKTMRRVTTGVASGYGWLVTTLCPDGVHCRYAETALPYTYPITAGVRARLAAGVPDGNRRPF